MDLFDGTMSLCQSRLWNGYSDCHKNFYISSLLYTLLGFSLLLVFEQQENIQLPYFWIFLGKERLWCFEVTKFVTNNFFLTFYFFFYVLLNASVHYRKPNWSSTWILNFKTMFLTIFFKPSKSKFLKIKIEFSKSRNFENSNYKTEILNI